MNEEDAVRGAAEGLVEGNLLGTHNPMVVPLSKLRFLSVSGKDAICAAGFEPKSYGPCTINDWVEFARVSDCIVDLVDAGGLLRAATIGSTRRW